MLGWGDQGAKIVEFLLIIPVESVLPLSQITCFPSKELLIVLQLTLLLIDQLLQLGLLLMHILLEHPLKV